MLINGFDVFKKVVGKASLDNAKNSADGAMNESLSKLSQEEIRALDEFVLETQNELGTKSKLSPMENVLAKFLKAVKSSVENMKLKDI